MLIIYLYIIIIWPSFIVPFLPWLARFFGLIDSLLFVGVVGVVGVVGGGQYCKVCLINHDQK